VAKLLSATLEEERTACNFIFSFFSLFFISTLVFFSTCVAVRQQFSEKELAKGFRKCTCASVVCGLVQMYILMIRD